MQELGKVKPEGAQILVVFQIGNACIQHFGAAKLVKDLKNLNLLSVRSINPLVIQVSKDFNKNNLDF